MSPTPPHPSDERATIRDGIAMLTAEITAIDVQIEKLNAQRQMYVILRDSSEDKLMRLEADEQDAE